MSNIRWRRCSACKQPILLGAKYWTCNVSTCNRKRTGLVFCTVDCWEVHLPSVNHRVSWAVENTAPLQPEPEGGRAVPGGTETQARRRIVQPRSSKQTAAREPREILIVASRLKDYVRARCGFNTSERILAPLSDIVRRACDEAIEKATLEGRTTILDRDIPPSSAG